MQKLTAICLSMGLLCVALFPLLSEASFYNGGGLEEGIESAQGFETGGAANPRETLRNIILALCSFMGIVAVLVIVIAGVILIIGGGDEQQRQKAWKMVLYAIIGLIIIVLAGAIVSTTVDIFS